MRVCYAGFQKKFIYIKVKLFKWKFLFSILYIVFEILSVFLVTYLIFTRSSFYSVVYIILLKKTSLCVSFINCKLEKCLEFEKQP